MHRNIHKCHLNDCNIIAILSVYNLNDCNIRCEYNLFTLHFLSQVLKAKYKSYIWTKYKTYIWSY